MPDSDKTDHDEYTPEQRKLVDRLQRLSVRMTSTRNRLGVLTEQRRTLLVRAYRAGIDTVQLGRIIGMSAETVRKSLEAELGSLRYPPKEGASREPRRNGV